MQVTRSTDETLERLPLMLVDDVAAEHLHVEADEAAVDLRTPAQKTEGSSTKAETKSNGNPSDNHWLSFISSIRQSML